MRGFIGPQVSRPPQPQSNHCPLPPQVTDTPGVLSRGDDERNKMELLTLAALDCLPTSVLFIIDLTEECGTSIADQWAIRCARAPGLLRCTLVRGWKGRRGQQRQGHISTAGMMAGSSGHARPAGDLAGRVQCLVAWPHCWGVDGMLHAWSWGRLAA